MKKKKKNTAELPISFSMGGGKELLMSFDWEPTPEELKQLELLQKRPAIRGKKASSKTTERLF